MPHLFGRARLLVGGKGRWGSQLAIVWRMCSTRIRLQQDLVSPAPYRGPRWALFRNEFVNPAVATNHQNPNPTTDNQLRAGSPAIGFADPNYALPFDITGKCRDSAPDAGAYER